MYDFSYSAQKIRLGGMKLYAADPGLYWASAPATNDGLAFSFETAVYLELRRRRKTGRLGDVSMLKLPSGKEVGFIEGDAVLGEASSLVQVCLDLGRESTRKRKVSALQEAMARFDARESAIVALDEEETLETPEGVIHILPAWKWLLR